MDGLSEREIAEAANRPPYTHAPPRPRGRPEQAGVGDEGARAARAYVPRFMSFAALPYDDLEKPTIVVTLRLPRSTYEGLREQAFEARTSLNMLVLSKVVSTGYIEVLPGQVRTKRARADVLRWLRQDHENS